MADDLTPEQPDLGGDPSRPGACCRLPGPPGRPADPDLPVDIELRPDRVRAAGRGLL